MADLPPQLPHGQLREVFPAIFFVTGQTRPNFGEQWQFSRNMTVLRDGQDLTLINTLRLDDAGLASLEALGSVKHIVKLGSFHGRDDAFYVRRYGPEVWAPAGMPHERGVKTTRELRHGEPGPVTGSSTFVFNTPNALEAVLRLDREGGVLVTCDSIQNMQEADEYFDELTAERMAAMGFLAKANLGPGWLTQGKPSASDFDALDSLSFRHILSAHGKPLLDDAKPALKTSVDAALRG